MKRLVYFIIILLLMTCFLSCRDDYSSKITDLELSGATIEIIRPKNDGWMGCSDVEGSVLTQLQAYLNREDIEVISVTLLRRAVNAKDVYVIAAEIIYRVIDNRRE